MTNRKKKLKIIQSIFLIFTCLIIFFTYYKSPNQELENRIIDKKKLDKVKEQISEIKSGEKSFFFNVEYSGRDLEGNRYVLKSKEAYSKAEDQNIVYMKAVNALFYFKDDSVLKLKSNKGEYNNETLDMNFIDNVKAYYENNKMYASKAEYSNKNGFLTITRNVKLESNQGTILADKLIFDINKKNLKITSFNDSNINANIKSK